MPLHPVCRLHACLTSSKHIHRPDGGEGLQYKWLADSETFPAAGAVPVSQHK